MSPEAPHHPNVDGFRGEGPRQPLAAPVPDHVSAPGSQFKNNYFTEMCSGSEAGSYLRLIDFVYHSTLGLRVIKKKKQGLGFADCSQVDDLGRFGPTVQTRQLWGGLGLQGS